MKKIMNRMLLLPIGLIRSLISIANSKARDIQNRRRFPNAIIDEDCCFTEDTTIGDSSHILKNCTINHSKIGSYTYISRNALIQNTILGNYCSIAHDVIIGLGDHPLDMFSTSPIFYKASNNLKVRLVKKDSNFKDYRPIHIGSDVWIGARVIVMGGVTIGQGSVIAAGAVVTKDVPSYAIVGGIPARIIRYRFPENTCRALERTRWWDKNAEEVYLLKEELDSICQEKDFSR